MFLSLFFFPNLFYSTLHWSTIRPENEITSNQLGKEEVKLSLPSDGILLYMEKPKKPAQIRMNKDAQ
jgi:hypothetical protein